MASPPPDDCSRVLPDTVASVTTADIPTAVSSSIQDTSRQPNPLNQHVLDYQKLKLESETELSRQRAHVILSSTADPALVDAMLNDFIDFGVRKEGINHRLTLADEKRRDASVRQLKEPTGGSLISIHRTSGNVPSGPSSSLSPGAKSLPLRINSYRPPPTADMSYEGSEKEPMNTLAFGILQQPTPLDTPTIPEADMEERTPSEPRRPGSLEGDAFLEAARTDMMESTSSVIARGDVRHNDVSTSSGHFSNKRKQTSTSGPNSQTPKRLRVEDSMTVAKAPTVDRAQTVSQPPAHQTIDLTEVDTDPVPGVIYLAIWPVTHDQLAVIVLPRGCFGDPSLFEIGLADCLAAPLERAPGCYNRCLETGNISGWAPGYEDGGPLVDRRLFPVAYLEAMGKEWSGRTAWLPEKDLTPFDLYNVEPLREHIANYEELVAFRHQRSEPSAMTEAQGCSSRVPDTDVPAGQARHGAHSAPSETAPPIQGAPERENAGGSPRGTYGLPFQTRRIQVKDSWAKDTPSSALSPASTPADMAQPPTPRDLHTRTTERCPKTAGPHVERRIQHGDDRVSPASVKHHTGDLRSETAAVRSPAARNGQTETARRGPDTPEQRMVQHSQHEGNSLAASTMSPLEAPREAAPAALQQGQHLHITEPFHKPTVSSKGPHQQIGVTPQAARPKRTPQYTLPPNEAGTAAETPRQQEWKRPLATSANDKGPSKDMRLPGSSKALGANQHNLRWEPPKITRSTAGTKHGLTMKTEEPCRLPEPVPKRAAPTTLCRSGTRPESPNSFIRGPGTATPWHPTSGSHRSKRCSGSSGGGSEPRRRPDTPATWPNGVPIASGARQGADRGIAPPSKFTGARGQSSVTDGPARGPSRPYTTQREGRELENGYDIWGGKRDPRRD